MAPANSRETNRPPLRNKTLQEYLDVERVNVAVAVDVRQVYIAVRKQAAVALGIEERHKKRLDIESVDPTKPATNQWDFLERAERVPESRLDEVISLNDLRLGARPPTAPRTNRVVARSTFGLPACVQRILDQGVTDNQRVTCFRLAVHLKRVGLPRDLAGNLIRSWAAKNRPTGGKRIITSAEITAQLGCAYRGSYRSHGCEEPAMQLFCDPLCPIRSRAAVSPDVPVGPCARDPAKPATRSTPMSTSPANQPVKEFRARNISLAIWQNEGIRHGQPVTLHSVTLNKRYYDKETDEWKDSSSFFPDDLPRLRLLLDKAYEHLLLRDRDKDREKLERSATKPADAVAV